MRILFFFCLSATLIAAPTPSGFARPPTADGPGVFWFWFDNAVTKKEITRQIQDIQSKGFSRVEIRSVKFNWRNDVDKEKEMRATGHKPLRYLSPEHIIHLRHALAEAKRLGMKVTLNTGMGWPPGGTWVAPHDRARYATLTSARIPANKKAQLRSFTLADESREFRCVGWDLENDKNVVPDTFFDLTSSVTRANGTVTVPITPSTKDRVVTFLRLDNFVATDKGEGFAVDPASRTGVISHLRSFFQPISGIIGQYGGGTLDEISSDSWEYAHENNFSWKVVEALKSQGIDYFKNAHVLAGFGPNGSDYLGKLAQTERRLVRENFFAAFHREAQKRGLKFKSQNYGRGLDRDLFATYAAVDIPEIEEGVPVPQAVWTAHLLNKPVSKEAFTYLLAPPADFEETLQDLLLSAANGFVDGAERLVYSTYSYSPSNLPAPGWALYAPVHLNQHSVLWEGIERLNEWTRRMQYLARETKPADEILVYPADRMDTLPSSNGILGVSASLIDEGLVRVPPPSVHTVVSKEAPTSKRAKEYFSKFGPAVKKLNGYDLKSLSLLSKVRTEPAEDSFRFARRSSGLGDYFYILSLRTNPARPAFRYRGNLVLPHTERIENWNALDGTISPVDNCTPGEHSTLIPLDWDSREIKIVAVRRGKKTVCRHATKTQPPVRLELKESRNPNEWEVTLSRNDLKSRAVFFEIGDVIPHATLIVNGKATGMLWRFPFRVNVRPQLKVGKNTLSLRIPAFAKAKQKPGFDPVLSSQKSFPLVRRTAFSGPATLEFQ